MDTATDSEGNAYRIVRIGDQVWMADNLRTTSPSIPHRMPANSDALVALGRFYQLYDPQTMDLRDVSSILMTGWRLPANEDWEVLLDVLRASPSLIAEFAPAYAGEIDWHGAQNGVGEEAWYWSATMAGADHNYPTQYCFRRAAGGGVSLSCSLNRAYASVRFFQRGE